MTAALETRPEFPRELISKKSHLGSFCEAIVREIDDWLHSPAWAAGGIWSITGSRGAGKSTALRTILKKRLPEKLGEHHLATAFIEPDYLCGEAEHVLPALLLAMVHALETDTAKHDPQAIDKLKEMIYPLVADPKLSESWVAAVSGSWESFNKTQVGNELQRLGTRLALRDKLAAALAPFVGGIEDATRGVFALAIDDFDLVDISVLEELLRVLFALRGVPGLLLLLAADRPAVGAVLANLERRRSGREPEATKVHALTHKTLGSCVPHISTLSLRRMADVLTDVEKEKDFAPWAQEVARCYFFEGLPSDVLPPFSKRQTWIDWLDARASRDGLSRKILYLVQPATYRTLVRVVNEMVAAVVGRRAARDRDVERLLEINAPQPGYDELKQRVRVLLVRMLYASYPEDEIAMMLYRDGPGWQAKSDTDVAEAPLLDCLADLVLGYDVGNDYVHPFKATLDDTVEAKKRWNERVDAEGWSLESCGFDALAMRKQLPGDWAYAAWYWRGFSQGTTFEITTHCDVHVTDTVEVDKKKDE